MRRRVLFLLVLLLGTIGLGAQSIDLIVMVDTSESMFRVFPEIVDFLLEDLLTERLRFGDTFHLLTFSDTPEVEIALPIDSELSIELVLRRLLLLKPLGGYTDLVAALRYLAGYARELPEGNRKTILLLTDGVHDPPPDSSFRMDPEETRRELFQTAQEIARSGWKVSILRLPTEGFASNGVSGGGAPGAGAGSTTGGSGATAATGGETRSATSTAGDGGAEASGGAAAGTTGGGTTGGNGSASTRGSEAAAGAGAAGPTSTEPPATGVSSGAGEASRTTPGGGGASADYVDEIARALRAPVTELGASGTNGDLPSAVGFPTIEFPTGVIRGGKRTPVTFLVRSGSPAAVFVELESVRRDDGTELLAEPATTIVAPDASRELRATLLLPDGTPEGALDLTVELSFAGGLRVSPSKGVIHLMNTGRPGLVRGVLGQSRAGGGTLLLVLLLVGGVGVVTLIVLGVRTRVDIGSWARGIGYAEGRFAKERGAGHPLVEMVVTMQNHHIGHRNVHSLAPGGSRTVGGGRSAYLIYFVPVPPDMGYLTYDGRTYTFVPTRAELFPRLTGQVADCLGKEIPARSPKGYPITIVFRPFRSPLDEINDLMRSIRIQAPASGDRGGKSGA